MASYLAWGRGARLGGIWTTGFLIVKEDYDDDGKLGVQFALAISAVVARTAFILTPTWATRAYGWTIVNAARYLAAPAVRATIAVVTNPYVAAAAVPIAVGGIISYAVDPEDGLNNYAGFITGGIVGEDQINYWDTDDNDSGYFNMKKNFETIAETQPLTRALTWTISETNKKVDSWVEILGL
tara:strand:- start:196 stop:744 length:549 start_codon:yes stop_codon:yes gene_type:complete